LLPDPSLDPDPLLLWLLSDPSVLQKLHSLLSFWSIICSLIHRLLPDQSLLQLLLIHRFLIAFWSIDPSIAPWSIACFLINRFFHYSWSIAFWLLSDLSIRRYLPDPSLAFNHRSFLIQRSCHIIYIIINQINISFVSYYINNNLNNTFILMCLFLLLIPFHCSMIYRMYRPSLLPWSIDSILVSYYNNIIYYTLIPSSYRACSCRACLFIAPWSITCNINRSFLNHRLNLSLLPWSIVLYNNNIISIIIKLITLPLSCRFCSWLSYLSIAPWTIVPSLIQSFHHNIIIEYY